MAGKFSFLKTLIGDIYYRHFSIMFCPSQQNGSPTLQLSFLIPFTKKYFRQQTHYKDQS